MFALLSPQLTQLHKFGASHCIPLRNIDCGCIAIHCVNITSLDISGYNNSITDVGIITIALNLTQIEEFSLPFSMAITDRSIAALAEKCANLHILSVSRCTNITNETLHCLIEHSKQLREFHCFHCPRVSQAGLSSFQLSMPSVTVRCTSSTLTQAAPFSIVF